MGADYKHKNRQSEKHNTVSTVAGGATEFFGAGFDGAVENMSMRVMPIGGTFMHMFAHASGGPGVGETFTYTLRVNGANSALTCQTVNPNETSEDLVNAVQVQRGDRICTQIVVSAGANARYHRTGYKFIPDE